MINLKEEVSPAIATSKKFAKFIASDAIEDEKGDRGRISRLAEEMNGGDGYLATQEVVKDLLGEFSGIIDPRVLEECPDQVNVQIEIVRAEITSRLEYYSRPIVGRGF